MARRFLFVAAITRTSTLTSLIPQPAKRLLFQNTQEFGLQVDGNFSYFVKENRATGGKIRRREGRLTGRSG